MTKEEKQLLLVDLCARLPYGVQCEIGGLKHGPYTFTGDDVEDLIAGRLFKPYLRPMSSVSEMWGGLTEEEIENPWSLFDSPVEALDYFLMNHIDFRGLIPMGLALEAPDGMYKND